MLQAPLQEWARLFLNLERLWLTYNLRSQTEAKHASSDSSLQQIAHIFDKTIFFKSNIPWQEAKAPFLSFTPIDYEGVFTVDNIIRNIRTTIFTQHRIKMEIIRRSVSSGIPHIVTYPTISDRVTDLCDLIHTESMIFDNLDNLTLKRDKRFRPSLDKIGNEYERSAFTTYYKRLLHGERFAPVDICSYQLYAQSPRFVHGSSVSSWSIL